MLQPVRYRFSVDDYHRMAEAGVLGADDRVELLDGEVIVMSPMGSPHAACVSRFVRSLAGLVGPAAIIRPQLPIRLSKWSEPEPDVVVANDRSDFYVAGHPEPADIVLLVEVSETTLRYRDFKAPFYAEAGIVEVWIADLQSDTILVHREPGPSGYGSVTTARRSDVISPLAMADLRVAVDDVLP